MKLASLYRSVVWSLLIAPSGLAGVPEVWQTRSSPVTNQLNAVAWGNDLFVAVGGEMTILTSTDGVAWNQRPAAGGSSRLFSVAYGNGRFVAGGEVDALIRSSTDGIHWTNGINTTGMQQIFGITYGYGLFVAMGRGVHADSSYILTSSNGLDWTSQNVPTTNTLFAVAPAYSDGLGWADDLYVAVGDRGTIVTSTNGLTWTLRNSGTQVPLRAVRFHYRFFAAGDNGVVLTSSDGSSWTPSAPPSFHVKGLASSQQALVAVGDFNGGGRLHASSDGLGWPGNASLFPQLLTDVCYGNSRFVAVGNNGFIIQSESSLTGATNDWIKPTSGYWEEPYWSLGQLPSITNGAVAFRNPGFKALAIGSSTTAGYADSLSIKNLLVDAPDGSANLLLLNYAGLDVPLNVESDFILGTNGSLLSYYSSLRASNFWVGGRATFSEGATAMVGNMTVDSYGEMRLEGGALLSQTLDVSGTSAHFVQSGGTHTNSRWMFAHSRANGSSYTLDGGLLVSPSLFIDGGEFNQSGGTNRAQWLYIDLSSAFNLGGGTLATSNSTVTSHFVSNRERRTVFTQTGGNHVSQNYLTLDAGIYRLEGGTLMPSNIYIWVDGELHLDGGALNNAGLLTLDNGVLLARGQHSNLGKLRVVISGAISQFPEQPVVSTLDLQNASTVLHFQDSHDLSVEWTGRLWITNWSGSTNGGGVDQLFVGTTAQGLTDAQLARITFINPEGLPPGNYPTRILPSGELVPGARPSLAFSRSSNALVLSWGGNYELLTATNVTGPYALISGAASPYTNSLTGPQRYFQLRSVAP